MFLAISNTAYGSKTVSGVVAVSTGPMQAYTQSIGRDLAAGDDVFLNDQVETGETTRAQVMLRDESVFSLAPSSKVLFDEFVYDPMAGEGVLRPACCQVACALCQANCRKTNLRTSRLSREGKRWAFGALKLWLSMASRGRLFCSRGPWKLQQKAVVS